MAECLIRSFRMSRRVILLQQKACTFRLLRAARFICVVAALTLSGESRSATRASVPAITVGEKLRAIILPVAPFVREDDDVCSILDWLQVVSKLADPDAVGIGFVCKVPSSGVHREYQEEFLVPSEVRGPHIRSVPIADFLDYLVKIRGLNMQIKEDSVVISRGQSEGRVGGSHGAGADAKHPISRTNAPPVLVPSTAVAPSATD
jgi:hypothetical protein